jgi:hypothetical protein
MTILNYPLYKDKFFKWRSLSDIPNQKGFRFVGKRKDGLSIVCEVAKEEESGCHHIKGHKIGEFQSWRMLTEEDETLLKN